MQTPLVLVTGTIGAGKSTLIEAISGVLHERGLRHGLFDLDWLGQLYPAPDDADPHNMNLQIKGFASLLPHFIDGGATCLIVGSTIESRAQLDRFTKATGATDVTVVLVEADPETIHERIRAREFSPTLLEDFLARTDQLAITIKGAGMHDLAVWNSEGDINDLAGEVLEHLGW